MKPEQLSTWSGVVDEDEVEVDTELQAALARARRLRQTENSENNIVPKVIKVNL